MDDAVVELTTLIAKGQESTNEKLDMLYDLFSNIFIGKEKKNENEQENETGIRKNEEKKFTPLLETLERLTDVVERQEFLVRGRYKSYETGIRSNRSNRSKKKQGIGSKLKSGLNAVIAIITKAIQTVGKFLKSLGGTLGYVVPVIAVQLAGLANAVKDGYDNLVSRIKNGTILSDIFRATKETIWMLNDRFSKLWNNYITEKVPILGRATELAQKSIEWIKNQSITLKNILNDVGSDIRNWLDSAKPIISGFFDFIKKSYLGIQFIVEKITNAISRVIAKIPGFETERKKTDRKNREMIKELEKRGVQIGRDNREREQNYVKFEGRYMSAARYKELIEEQRKTKEALEKNTEAMITVAKSINNNTVATEENSKSTKESKQNNSTNNYINNQSSSVTYGKGNSVRR